MAARNIQLVALLGSATLLGACAAATAQAGPAKSADAKAPDQFVAVGDPVDCIPLNRISSTRVRDDQTIDFMLGNKIFRNSLPNKCPSLGFQEKFSYATSLSQLCSVDIIHVLYNDGGGLQKGAGCGLGKFQQVEKVSAAAQ